MKKTLLAFLLSIVPVLAPDGLAALEVEGPGNDVDLEGGMTAVPVIKANTLFRVSDGDAEWKAAYSNATRSLDELGVQPQRFAELMQDGFRRVHDFRSEAYSRNSDVCEITMLICAKEAWVEPNKPNEVYLDDLRIVFYISPSTMSLAEKEKKEGPRGQKSQKAQKGQKAQTGEGQKTEEQKPDSRELDVPSTDDQPTEEQKADNPKTDSPKTETPKAEGRKSHKGSASKGNASKGSASNRPTAAALSPALRQSRVVITSEKGLLNLTTGEGFATTKTILDAAERKKGVRIEIFSMAADGLATEPVGDMTCEGLQWRAWNDPRSGASEVTLRAISDDPEVVDPPVTGRFTSKNAETGEQSEMEIRGQGMIFQTSILDTMRPVLDGEGRTMGVTNVARRRVLFHRQIGVRIDGSGSPTLIPFQQAPEPVEGGKETVRKKAAKAPGPPTRTVVYCKGPGILDLAVPPRTLPTNQVTRMAPLAMRFEFLNGVEMHKFPRDQADAQQNAGTTAVLKCQHLCFQFPAASPTTLPEYAEATGGIHMTGTRVIAPTRATTGARAAAPTAAPAAAPTAAPAVAPTPFKIDCQRVYFDGATDATVLEGLPTSPVEIVDGMGELSTRACVISRKTQQLYMPYPGPKRALVRGARKETTVNDPNAATAIDLSGGDLEAKWFGTFRREIVPVLGPGNRESMKEVLRLDKDVDIWQAQKGLRINGQTIRIVRDVASTQVERLEGSGGILVRNGDMQVKGDSVTVDLRYNEKNEVIQNTVIVWCLPDSKKQAILWQGQSAVKGEKFVIDALNNNFQAYGGVVARFSRPQSTDPKGAEASGGMALMPGFSSGGATGAAAGKPGSNLLALQCDGDFEFEGATGQLRVTRNVLIQQEGMSIVADGMLLKLATPSKDEKKDEKSDKKDAKTDTDKKDKKTDKKTDEKKDEKKDDGGLFSGGVQSIECRGQVEITTLTQVVHCDRLFCDMVAEKVFLETDRADDKVRIYLQDPSGGTKILEVPRRLDCDQKSGLFTPAERMTLKPYPDSVPLPRRTVAPPGGSKP